jgi:hypothetical protein
MAKAGDELVNPVTGLRTKFRKTAQDTSGELLQVDWIGEPGWTTGPDHVHPQQEERFEVLSGKQDRDRLRDLGGAGARRQDQQRGSSREPAAVRAHPARVRGGDIFRLASVGRSEGDLGGAGKGRAATRVPGRIPLSLRQAK